jgi:hypothetical protein
MHDDAERFDPRTEEVFKVRSCFHTYHDISNMLAAEHLPQDSYVTVLD